MNPEHKKHKIHITSRLVWLYFKNQIRGILAIISSVQFSLSVLSESCDQMDCSMLGFPVHNELPELTQTHVHRVGDAIQPSHPLSSPSPPAFNLSQNQSLFQEVSYLHHVAKVLRVSPSASSLPMNIQDWFPLGLTGWISWQFKGLSRVFSNTTTIQNYKFFGTQLYGTTLTLYMTTGKTIALTRQTFVDRVMSLLFNMLSRLVIAFLIRSKCLNFMAAVTICSDFGAQENKVCHCFHCFPIYLPWTDGTNV